MKVFNSLIVILLSCFALLHAAPFAYLPQVQECSLTQITIPLTKGTFKLCVSEHPEKSSPFIQALINDKITANIYPENNSASGNILIQNTDVQLISVP